MLIADDEHLVASGIASILTDLGHAVVGPATDGNAAIELCQSHHPDMALLDIRMEGKDGLSAAEVIYRELCIPVIMLSAYSDPEYVAAGTRVGVFGYLLKPVTHDQLRVAISVAWGRYCDHVKQTGDIRALEERLEHRKLIEQAKWIIVKRKSIPEPDAMRMLQAQARNNRRPLINVARAIIESEALLGD